MLSALRRPDPPPLAVPDGQWTALPAPRQVRLPRAVRVAIAVMVGCTLLSLAALGAAGRARAGQPATGRWLGFATLVAENYVAGHQLQVPLAAGLDPGLGRLSQAASSGQLPGMAPASTALVPLPVVHLAPMSSTDVARGRDTIETDVFGLELTDGTLLELAVVVDGTPRGPVLADVPSLLAGPAASPQRPPVQSGVPAAQAQEQLPSGVVAQVGRWAQAYAADDEQTLYELTGDSTPRRYVGLGGFHVVGQPTVLSSTYATRSGRPPAQVVVTVSVEMAADANPGLVVESTYDLLVTNVADYLPNVAAWGPPGSGPQLVPFQNGR